MQRVGRVVTTSDEAIAALKVSVTAIEQLVSERTIFLSAQAALGGGAKVISFTVGSPPVNVPITQSLDGTALALVNGAVAGRLSDIATALAVFGVTE